MPVTPGVTQYLQGRGHWREKHCFKAILLWVCGSVGKRCWSSAVLGAGGRGPLQTPVACRLEEVSTESSVGGQG